MEENKVYFKEVVQLFIHDILHFIKAEYEVPNVDFLFPKEAFQLFEEVKNHPFTKKDCFIPHIQQTDIENLTIEYDNTTPVILVHDPILFFEYLTKITNQLRILYEKYDLYFSARYLCIAILKRIWLRMGTTDFQEVEEFLRKQLEFINDATFYDLKNKKVSEFYGCNIYAHAGLNHTYDESTRKMSFKISKENIVHDLPEIYYGILDTAKEKICYIYAIQNNRHRKINKKLSRLLYKLNAGILALESEEYLAYKNDLDPYYPENISDVSPGHLFSLLLFINLLKENEIHKIRIPILQVLSYDWHILLSEKAKEDFLEKWTKEKIENIYNIKDQALKEIKEQEYLFDQMWYEHIVEKEDFISKNKTEVLYRLIRRACYHDSDIRIKNEPLMEGDYIDVELDDNKKRLLQKNRSLS